MYESIPLRVPARSDQPDTAQGSVFFIGTATTVINLGGFTILTDPNFLHAGDNAHLGYGLKATRLTNPAVDIHNLPALDLCLLSHMHGDHWDEVAQNNLDKELLIVSTHHAVKELRKQGFRRLYPLETWEHMVLQRENTWLRITAMPAQHGPGALNGLLPETMGSMLEWGRVSGGSWDRISGGGWGRVSDGDGDPQPEYRLYISGDTLIHDDLVEIPLRFPDINLALLHLGGERGMGVPLSMDAHQGIQAISILNPRLTVPIHHSDYDIYKSTQTANKEYFAAAKLSAVVRYLDPGETYQFEL
jgi:L-ascorbate metabolism protein UlaG (beta-lactamase superfamily)